jgi:hypothetical protein
MISRTAKIISIATVVMSFPLFFSFNIKYQWFPEGFAYGLLSDWGLLSVYVVPALLLCGIIVLVLILLSSSTSRKSSLRWNLLGIIIAMIAEVVFIAARYSPP